MKVHQQIFQMLDQPMVVLQEKNGEISVEDANFAFLDLIGYTLPRLKAKEGKELAERFHIDLSKRILKSEIRLKTKARVQLRLRIEQLPLPESPGDDCRRALIIAEDLTAYSWIEQQLERGKVLMSGVVDKHLHIRFLRDSLAPLMFEPDQTLEDETLLQFIAENDRERLLQLMNEACEHYEERSLTIHTSKLSGVELELELTFSPIRNGVGKCNVMAFVIWDFRPVGEDEIDPSMKLKIWMAKRDMTAGQLSEATGISLQTISKLRNGKINKPQRLTAELIASELGIETSAIWPATRK
ncbi:helix-turn-helix domain-containing protein [Paenibacillus soyae]|uniref:Helix-turn-helix transcriptional regulator n=1 Tax=Paenibacillus soyae TaxID=2969249 RepID=A0A9X2MM36_9BACL|nr:helix-turn-helix transcriptional regulator [Paenibacillus soyae]MCR2803156.1 helix-turn-helix transcriptional regulator [Paenibacillus soyae]